jgi:hypothetical protein
MRLAWAAGAFLIVQAAWIGYLNIVGTWDDYLDIQRNYTIPYSDYRWLAGSSYTRSLFEFTAAWMGYVPYITVPAWIALFVGPARGAKPGTYLMASLAALGVLSVWWQGKLLDYHWQILLPLLAPLAGFTYDQALGVVQRLARPERYASYVALGLAVIVLTIGPVWQKWDIYNLFLDRVGGEITQVQVEDWYLVEFRLNREVVDYIRQHGDPDDSFFIWGFWTHPYWWEERPLPSRFMQSNAVRAAWSPVEWRWELVGDLRAAEPRFIAVAAGDHQPWLTGTDDASDQSLCGHYPELLEFIDSNYKAVLNNGLFVLYDSEATEHLAKPRCVP